MVVKASLGYQSACRKYGKNNTERMPEQALFKNIGNDDGGADHHEKRDAPRRPPAGTAHALVVQGVVEDTNQSAYPGHRVSNCLHQPIRITHQSLDQKGKKRKRDEHGICAPARRKSRRRATVVPGCPGTIHRPVDRYQSPFISRAAPVARPIYATAGARRTRPVNGRRGHGLWSAVTGTRGCSPRHADFADAGGGARTARAGGRAWPHL